MSKPRKKDGKTKPNGSNPVSPKSWRWVFGLVGVLIAGGIVAALVSSPNEPRLQPPSEPASAPSGITPVGNLNSGTPTTPTPPSTGKAGKTAPEWQNMEVAHAVMVTVELDFGPTLPTIAEAVREIERRYVPDDKNGRTFAILDAYGNPTADGKLHLSMHVSSEKTGNGSLIFRRTGEVLWQCKIVPSPNPPPEAFKPKNLGILLDTGTGKSVTVDGSNGPQSVLDAKVKELNIPVHDFWPDGTEKEVTFLYSMCGCPVKVMVRRIGTKTVRTRDMPVIFPDDPAVVTTIEKLMGW